MSYHNDLITPFDVLHEFQSVTGTSDDALMLKLTRDVSAQIARYADREFVPRIQTRYFDAIADVDGRKFTFDLDLLEATTVTNGDALTVSATAYVTEPRNDTPYHAITLKASAGLVWTYEQDPENALSLLGVWGYHTEYADAWVRAMDTSASASESGDVSVTGTLYAGQLAKIDDEIIYVTTQSTSAGVTGCERGANGSTAAGHVGDAGVYVWQPEFIVRELAREGAAALYRLRGNPLAEAYVAADGTTFTTPKDVGKWLEKRVIELGLRRN